MPEVHYIYLPSYILYLNLSNLVVLWKKVLK